MAASRPCPVNPICRRDANIRMPAIRINDKTVLCRDGTTVAAAVLAVEPEFRRSVTGEPRGPLCGMGICFECRVTLNGERHVRSCMVIVETGMEVLTDDNRRD